jgi:hypothetical protein
VSFHMILRKIMDAWQGVKYSSCKCMYALGSALEGQHQCSLRRATLQSLANIT